MTDTDPHENVTPASLDEGVSLLEKLGLTQYAARTFLALHQLGSGTAREVSEASSVPRTKVYDVMEELQQLGLVEVRYTSPRQYAPVSKEATKRRFQREYEQSITRLSTILSELPSFSRDEKIDALSILNGEDAVLDRTTQLIQSADKDIVYVSVSGSLPDLVPNHLQAAAERGVDVFLGGLGDESREQVTSTLSCVVLNSSPGIWDESEIDSILVVDHTTVLVTVPNETDLTKKSGMWGRGKGNMLVATFEPVVRSWLESESGRW
ncbi:transcriptional regulator TrmB [Halogranum rubrum]|uniref:Transcriptional regulator TrmB n=1 Tax=Halogranum rubrum TaxID=553466 RepID=A0A1I4B1B1_9EURY|nr:helix-turn-helix domain-containing protein [Halogranum rubrum]SFK62160.1 transcriptional regulator TrmB [Halogranum rubrum]